MSDETYFYNRADGNKIVISVATSDGWCKVTIDLVHLMSRKRQLQDNEKPVVTAAIREKLAIMNAELDALVDSLVEVR